MHDVVSGYRMMEPGSVYNCVRKRDHNNCGQQMLFVCLFDSVRCAFFLLPLVMTLIKVPKNVFI